MLNNESLLETKKLSLYFGKVCALDGVNLKVKEGDLTAIIGPNGAGKTSLFNVITGLYRVDEGTILFQGKRINSLASHKIVGAGIGRSFQITNIFPTLSTFENIQIACLVRRRKNLNMIFRFEKLDEGPVNDILETVGLTEKANTLAGSLSHGDQRTLEIGIALASRPKLLLLDEPTSGMSSWETSLITDLIKNISEEMDITILFVEHDMKVAFSIAEKIVVMHQGKIFIEGKPDQISADHGVRKIYLGEED